MADNMKHWQNCSVYKLIVDISLIAVNKYLINEILNIKIDVKIKKNKTEMKNSIWTPYDLLPRVDFKPSDFYL